MELTVKVATRPLSLPRRKFNLVTRKLILSNFIQLPLSFIHSLLCRLHFNSFDSIYLFSPFVLSSFHLSSSSNVVALLRLFFPRRPWNYFQLFSKAKGWAVFSSSMLSDIVSIIRRFGAGLVSRNGIPWNIGSTHCCKTCEAAVLAIWQTFAGRIQTHPKVRGSRVLLEMRERVAKVSSSLD